MEDQRQENQNEGTMSEEIKDLQTILKDSIISRDVSNGSPLQQGANPDLRKCEMNESSESSSLLSLKIPAYDKDIGGNDKKKREFPLKIAKVLFPVLQESSFHSYLIYKVHFIWMNKEMEVYRRFSDFKELRKALQCFMPFNYIFPVHKQQIVVG
jgi:hypothetical protein